MMITAAGCWLVRTVVILALCLGVPRTARSQEISPVEEVFEASGMVSQSLPAPFAELARPVPYSWHAPITNLPADWASLGQMTFRTDALPTIAGLGVLTTGLILMDHELYTETRRAKRLSPFMHSASDIVVHAGDGTTHLAIAGGFALGGLIASDARALRTAGQTVEALLASGITVQMLKRITGRESPEVCSRPRGHWRPLPGIKEYNRNQPRYYAFPSGHITTTMATVTVIAENYPELTWIRPVGYVIVGAVGIGLVAEGYHWYSDLPLGIALGYAFGTIAARHGPGAADVPAEEQAVRIGPTILPGGAGIAMSYTF